MSGPADVIAAVAASVGAVLSGASLLVVGRREERKWRRDNTIGTVVALLDASFIGAGNNVLKARKAGGHSLDSHRAYQTTFHDIKNENLTRLRLVGDRHVVEAAIELYKADRVVRDLLLDTGTPLDDHEIQRKMAVQAKARRKLLDSARKTIGLDAALDQALSTKPSSRPPNT